MEIGWLSDLPSEWEIVPFGALFTQSKRKNDALQRDFVLSVMKDRGVIPYTEKGNVGNKVSDDLSKYKLVDPGDFVLNSMNLYMGSVGVSDYEGITSTAYIVCKPRPGVRTGFYRYLIQSRGFQEFVGLLGKGIMEIREAVRWTALKSVPVPLPDVALQEAIALFLDRETARIEQLIEKKRRLVELLLEREKNLISEHLARGIQTGVTYKQTPLEWLGKIPRHWDVYPLKSLVWYQEGPGILAEDFQEEGVPLLRIKGLAGQYASLEGCNYLDPVRVSKRWNHFRVEVGDFLISASATRGGIASLVTEETAGAIPYTGIIRIKPRPKGYVSEIIPYFLLSSLFEAQIDLLSAGSTIQHFGPSHLGRMKAPFPPQDEQLQIARVLNSRVPRIRATREKTEESQELLREFRVALVTAAVTGQIDVTTWRKRGQTDRRLDQIEEAMRT